MKRPVIGLTTTLEEGLKRHELWRAYPTAIDLAGGLPIILPTDEKYPHYAEYLDLIDGLLLTGGQDIHPLLYNEPPQGGLTETWPMCLVRDRFEIEITRLAIKQGIPILGLCRGLQLLVVALGGTLWQDVSFNGTPPTQRIRHFQNLDPKWPSHEIELTGERLKDIYPKSSMLVNSLHHQSARDIPLGLKAAGVAADAIVEAIEGTTDLFVVGVQWHPELLVRTDKLQLNLFQAFVAAAHETRSR
ncbi:MAG: gamma-glutamyl-gamma-aminobutyrate hydrolase family protein [Deltaproteobacteria bacterium]|jgi:putative glutamine amidotransferase|nr:gamma-glutamyl-gamma-aminobutyrate hydrolase family protein [Deltaproteobacteria bacterium]